MNKEFPDLRFTEIEFTDNQNEIVVDYYGYIIACIIKHYDLDKECNISSSQS
jgi:hypothetical protein